MRAWHGYVRAILTLGPAHNTSYSPIAPFHLVPSHAWPGASNAIRQQGGKHGRVWALRAG